MGPITLPRQRTDLGWCLDRYVRAVATVLDVPASGTSSEVSDTATAYVALGCTSADHPGRDIMLVWSASDGWRVLVEPLPGEAAIPLSHPMGDLVPAPRAVARLVADAVAPHRRQRRRLAVLPPGVSRTDLAERMERVADEEHDDRQEHRSNP